MKPGRNVVPNFRTEAHERQFWLAHSPLDYMDVDNPKKAVFPSLKPSTRTSSIRLPEDLLNSLKVLANRMDVPYQSLAKVYLARQIQLEQKNVGKKKD